MNRNADSWLSETLRDYLRYLAAAMMTIPAGVAYAFLTMHGLERWWTVSLILTLSLVLAHIGWVLATKFLLTSV